MLFRSDDLRFSNTTGILQKNAMWFIGVEVEQETSAPPPTKNPGSAPDVRPLVVRPLVARALLVKTPLDVRPRFAKSPGSKNPGCKSPWL